MAEIAIRQVAKRFGSFTALHSVDLTIADQEFMVLLGASGCGKTTLLRIIAGLETPSQGEVWIGGRRVDRIAGDERDHAGAGERDRIGGPERLAGPRPREARQDDKRDRPKQRRRGDRGRRGAEQEQAGGADHDARPRRRRGGAVQRRCGSGGCPLASVHADRLRRMKPGMNPRNKLSAARDDRQRGGEKRKDVIGLSACQRARDAAS